MASACTPVRGKAWVLCSPYWGGRALQHPHPTSVGPHSWVLQDSPFEGCYQEVGCWAFLEMHFFPDEESPAFPLPGVTEAGVV